MSYSHISWDNIRSTVSILQQIALSLKGYAAVLGVEALNEPWQFTPMDVLKAFYWDSYWAVRAAAPQWLFVIQDSFRLEEWAGFMKGCPAVALDTHISQAWFDIRSQSSFKDNACSWRDRLAAIQRTTLPVLVGEWSLATDSCQMWLQGFHDNAPGYPKVRGESVPPRHQTTLQQPCHHASVPPRHQTAVQQPCHIMLPYHRAIVPTSCHIMLPYHHATAPHAEARVVGMTPPELGVGDLRAAAEPPA